MSQQDQNESNQKSHCGGFPVAFDLDKLADFDASAIRAEPVEPVDQLYSGFGGRCLALRGVFTPVECQHLITGLTASGSLEQVQYRQDYRCNDRCIFESKELADVLWARVKPFAETLAVSADPVDPSQQWLLGSGGEERQEKVDCPEELRLGYGKGGVWRPFGLNECLRFCRYSPGGFFRAHCDASFRRSEEEMSLFTCMFYLDGSLEGGATRFLEFDSSLNQETSLLPAADDQVVAKVQPEPGLCLLFFQTGLLHEGEDLKQGVKHILRTDVMFRREPGTGPQRTPQEEEAWSLAQQAETAEAAGECQRACELYRRAFKLDRKLERMF
jgi:hypothetical protein